MRSSKRKHQACLIHLSFWPGTWHACSLIRPQGSKSKRKRLSGEDYAQKDVLQYLSLILEIISGLHGSTSFLVANLTFPHERKQYFSPQVLHSILHFHQKIYYFIIFLKWITSKPLCIPLILPPKTTSNSLVLFHKLNTGHPETDGLEMVCNIFLTALLTMQKNTWCKSIYICQQSMYILTHAHTLLSFQLSSPLSPS